MIPSRNQPREEHTVTRPGGGSSSPRKDAFVVEIVGAGWLALSPNCSCGHADGIAVDPSWSPHGYSGGVMDIKDMIAMRNWLTEQINVFTDAAKENESIQLEPVKA